MLGHEGCGEVVRSARPGITTGERLTFSVTDVCGKCEFSRSVMSRYNVVLYLYILFISGEVLSRNV